MPHATLVIVPIHDEAAHIAALVDELRGYPVDVLVIDDGSHDDGPALARAHGAEVVSLTPNRGKGAALQHGLRCAVERGYQTAVSIDGDLEHDPADLPLFLKALDAGADLVVGQRQLHRSGTRKALNHFAGFFFRQLDPRVIDTTCGYRGFRTRLFADLALPAGFEIEQAVLLEAIRRGLALEFVPVRARPTRESGVTTRDLVRTNNAFDRWVLEHVDELPLGRGRRLMLRASARVGLFLGGVLERML